jgi:hypothetical protein
MTFEPIYQYFDTLFDVFDNQYSYLFTELYEESSYGYMFIISLAVPLILYLVFYYLLRLPYLTILHWLLVLFLVGLLTFGLEIAYLRDVLSEYLMSGDFEEADYTSDLVYFYSFLNVGFSIVFGIIFSFILKQWSKMYMHLPILKP